MTTRKLLTLQNGKHVPIESANETLDLSALRIGTDNLTISEQDVNTLTINGKRLKIGDGVLSTDASSKGQLDTAISSLTSTVTGNNSTLQNEINTINTQIAALQGEDVNQDATLATLTTDITAILGNTPKESDFIGDGVTTSFTASGFTFSALNTAFDIELFVDGRRMRQDTTASGLLDFQKLNSTTVTLTFAPAVGAAVTIWKQGTSSGSGGSSNSGISWSTPVNHSIVPDTNNLYDFGASAFKFKDGYFAGKLTVIGGIDPAYITLTPQPGPGAIPANALFIDSSDSNKIKLTDTTGSTTSEVAHGNAAIQLTLKSMRNLGTTIGIGKPVAKLANGSIALYSCNTVGSEEFIGITYEAITSGSYGRVILAGPNCPNAVTGLGFTVGQEVFLGTGGSYTTDETSLPSGSSVIRVGIADCADGTQSGTATDLIMFSDVLLRP